MSRDHHYDLTVRWTGDRGEGTTSPRAYSRDHDVLSAASTAIRGSSDPAFRGDATRWNPEQLLVASLSQCHMLWYLDLAARAGIVVTDYVDRPRGTMTETADGSGRFTHVTLRPAVTVTARSDLTLATQLHDDVGRYCFIARSVDFPVHHEPTTTAGAPPPDHAVE